MRCFYLLFCLLLVQASSAQKLLKGIVWDEKNTPVAKASVFLNNTSIGTMADNEGRFALSLPSGKFDLIVSSIGFITHSQSITATETEENITIRLKEKAPELEAVIIDPYEKDGWKKWGKWFMDNFLGTSEYSRDCRLVNPEVLKFRNSKKSNALTVIAIAPLIIENNALGYRISYQMENFRYDFKARYLLYAGFPFFEYMQGSDRKQRKWEKAREDVYYGSMLQFMRAVYRNRIIEEGFEVRQLKKVPNTEKQRVRAVYKPKMSRDGLGRLVLPAHNDSTDYYNEVIRQDDYMSIVGQTILSGDSIAYAIDSVVAGMYFADYLLVTYKHKTVPVEYKEIFPRSSNAMTSEINLINNRPVEIFSNGSYFNPEDLLNSGYWGWWEKIGTMLPFDYSPPAKK
ncbi:MAG TPA: carboxypeptidase-like regulatory domain-containing protein [Flavisolibacter sp.]|nr:carboxypeptidase-like regulatory domain-containing protein [Flavisolibacter sp.]